MDWVRQRWDIQNPEQIIFPFKERIVIYQNTLTVCGPSWKNSFNLVPKTCPAIGVPGLWPEGIAYVCPAAAEPKAPWLALLHCEHGCAGCQIERGVWSSCGCVAAEKGILCKEMPPIWKDRSGILEQDWQCKACLGRGHGQSTLWKRVVRVLFETCGLPAVRNTAGFSVRRYFMGICCKTARQLYLLFGVIPGKLQWHMSRDCWELQLAWHRKKQVKWPKTSKEGSWGIHFFLNYPEKYILFHILYFRLCPNHPDQKPNFPTTTLRRHNFSSEFVVTILLAHAGIYIAVIVSACNFPR